MKEIGYGKFRRKIGCVCSGGNPVTQRLTVFSEVASVHPKKIDFFFAYRQLFFDNRAKIAVEKQKKEPKIGLLLS